MSQLGSRFATCSPSRGTRRCSPPDLTAFLARARSIRIRRMASADAAEEVPAAAPMLGLVVIHQPDVRLVHQGRRLQRLPRLFLGQLGSRQFPQLVIHQRQQLLRRRRIAGFDLRQNLRHVGHGQGTGTRDEACDYTVACPRRASR